MTEEDEKVSRGTIQNSLLKYRKFVDWLDHKQELVQLYNERYKNANSLLIYGDIYRKI